MDIESAINNVLSSEENLYDLLKSVWGYESFRPLQLDIIQSVLNGNDTLALLPTGGGKSLCYQLPVLAKEGLGIVVSPLIALMEDQVQSLKSKGIKAEAIHSGYHYKELDRLLDNCIYGDIKFLFVSPERIETELFQSRVKKMKISLIAIDEAHCISQWGHDFRPSYYNIASLREWVTDVPLMALTATATPTVQEDIMENLGMKEGKIFKKSFKRENLSFDVLETEDKLAMLARKLSKIDGSSIIYARSRKTTKLIASYLEKNGISSSYYHAGLSMEERKVRQDQWLRGTIQNIVATNAFGMGIDKSDVRFVGHVDLPPSLEEYYQEAGRGGRDGQRAYALLLYDQSNIQKAKKDYAAAFPSIEEIKRIYRALNIYCNLAIGSGSKETFAFDLKEFSHRYQLNLTKSFYALKELERSAYILLNDGIRQTSKIEIKVNKEELYDYTVDHPEDERLIKLLLRNYEGILDDRVRISEQMLAKQAGMQLAIIKKRLKDLHRTGILIYESQEAESSITFLTERLTTDNLRIKKKAYDQRKKVAADRLKSVLRYLDETSCRQNMICHYFGEKDEFHCGCCDLCMFNQGIDKSSLKAKIRRELTESPVNFKAYVNDYPIHLRKPVLEILTYFESEEFISIKEGSIHWQKKTKV